MADSEEFDYPNNIPDENCDVPLDLHLGEISSEDEEAEKAVVENEGAEEDFENDEPIDISQIDIAQSVLAAKLNEMDQLSSMPEVTKAVSASTTVLSVNSIAKLISTPKLIANRVTNVTAASSSSSGSSVSPGKDANRTPNKKPVTTSKQSVASKTLSFALPSSIKIQVTKANSGTAKQAIAKITKKTAPTGTTVVPPSSISPRHDAVRILNETPVVTPKQSISTRLLMDSIRNVASVPNQSSSAAMPTSVTKVNKAATVKQVKTKLHKQKETVAPTRRSKRNVNSVYLWRDSANDENLPEPDCNSSLSVSVCAHDHDYAKTNYGENISDHQNVTKFQEVSHEVVVIEHGNAVVLTSEKKRSAIDQIQNESKIQKLY